MIPRYSRKIVKDIWEDNNRFQIWLDLEILACEAMEKYGYIPQGTTKKIKKKAKFKVKEIENIEKVTKHDVIAFLTNVAKYVGDESRFIHKGLTSSDILDSSFSIQLNQSSGHILDGLEKLNKSLLKISKKHKNTLCIGRSHGIHAEVTTFGLKMLGYFEENKRNIKRLKSSIDQIKTIQMSGPVGNYSNIDPKIEKYIVRLVDATRNPKKYNLELGKYVEFGSSPRASISLFIASKAHALLNGNVYVTPNDVKSVALNVFRHRLILTYEGQAENLDSDDVVKEMLSKVPVI